ncbi:hypothetical protein SAMN05444050_4992 [Afipia sp. GAS231]|nr:hypothetical protein [Afipia sp. GAS231]SDO78166.1 hypothetical protein SAMN05444050_4992 [Afipia sp. GAS231]
MPTQRIVLNSSLGLATMIGIAAASPAWSEEYRGTWEQQMACTPDVMRLCSDQIPDVNRIVACLRQNTPSLGNSCRAVFESSASADQSPARVAPPTTAQRPRAAQPAPLAPPRPSYNNDE